MRQSSHSFPSWLPYVLPYALYGAVSWIGADLLGSAVLGVLGRTLLPLVALVLFWKAGSYPELSLRPTLLGILVGLVGYGLWVWPHQLLSGLPKLGQAGAFDPDAVGSSMRVPWLALRLAGAVLVVPVFEELFLRSFLIRFIDSSRLAHGDFRRIPIGQFRWVSFLGVVVAMAVTHHLWLRAGAYSALMMALLYREKRIAGVIWAHAITNLCLGIHVIVKGAWEFW